MRVRPSGFTLVEILIATAIGSLVFTTAIMIFNYSGRSQGVTAAARALQTATLVEEQMTDDIHRAVLAKGGWIRYDEDRFSSLAFYAIDPAQVRSNPIQVKAVRYSLTDPPSYLKREWNARVESVGVSPLTSVRFVPFRSSTGPMVRVNLWVGRDPTDPPGPPIAHTFLLRLAGTSNLPTLAMKLTADFLDAGHAPNGQKLPPP